MPTIITVVPGGEDLVVTVEKDHLGPEAWGRIHAYPDLAAATAHQDHEARRIGVWHSEASGSSLRGTAVVSRSKAAGMVLVASQEHDGDTRTWSDPYAVPGAG